MTRAQQQAMWLAVLLMICALVYARAFRLQANVAKTSLRAPASAEMGRPLNNTAAGFLPQQRAAQRKRADELNWGRDPFTRGSRMEPSGLSLSGILWDPVHPIAIINDVTLAIGEQLERFRVLEIHPDYVVLTDGTRTYQLHIAP